MRIVPKLTDVYDYIYYHQMLWSTIVNQLYNMSDDEFNKLGPETIKYKVFFRLFDSKKTIDSNCFACQWAMTISNSCKLCLFGNFEEVPCLNGKWESFSEAKSKKSCIKWAEKIRDLKVSPKWLKGTIRSHRAENI